MAAAPQRKGRRRGAVGFEGGEANKRKLLMREIEKLTNPDNKCRILIGDHAFDGDSLNGELDYKKASTTKKSRKD